MCPTVPGAKILVVDDNADMRDYLRRILSLRWRVEVVNNGEQAVDCIINNPPDLIVTDINMAINEGSALIHEIRVNQRNYIPVLILTEQADEEATINSLLEGANDFIVEPFEAHELMTRVVAQLEISRIRQYNQQAILAAEEQYRQLNRALRLSQERYKSLMMVTAAIVWTAAPDGRIIEDVPMWEAFTGQTPAEYKGYGWLNALHPDDRDITLTLWIDALEIKHPMEALFRLRLRDGTYQQMLSVGVPVLDVDGSVWEWVGTVTEVRGGAEPPLRSDLSVY